MWIWLLCSSLWKQSRLHIKIGSKIVLPDKKRQRWRRGHCRNPSSPLLCDNHTALHMEMPCLCLNIVQYTNKDHFNTVTLQLYGGDSGWFVSQGRRRPGLIRCATPSSSAGRNALLVAVEAVESSITRLHFTKRLKNQAPKLLPENLKAADVSRSADRVNCGALR